MSISFSDFVDSIIGNAIIPLTELLMALAVTYYIWSIFDVIRKGSQPKDLAKLKSKAFWGVFAIAVMVSLWGLVYVVTNTFGWGSSSTPVEVHVIGL